MLQLLHNVHPNAQPVIHLPTKAYRLNDRPEQVQHGVLQHSNHTENSKDTHVLQSDLKSSSSTMNLGVYEAITKSS
jgi:hypothetical protein